MPELFREHQIWIVASMPCYLEENVCAQRGKGAYERSIAVIKRLNALGYGSNSELPLNLVYNPGGPFLPPLQSVLEEDYRRELGRRFGITFTHLLTITNMPLGRFRTELIRKKEEGNYLKLLRKSFNLQTVTGLMCRHQLSVDWNGTLYDCDFNLSLGLPVNHGAPDHIQSFRLKDLWKRRIVTGEHCFACTAGSGSSCGGALV
jgi:radical SAM/Cys-rich protein